MKMVNPESEKEELSRRQFLNRSLKASGAVVAACVGGYLFYDSTPPASSQPQLPGIQLPDFSIPAMDKKMAVVRGDNRSATLAAAFKALGGLNRFIKNGDRVLLKVNAAFATPPILSATSHPQLVSELTRLCYQAGASSVLVTDNPINDPASCFELTGIARAARSSGAKVLLPEANFFMTTSLPDAKLIKNWPVLYEPLKSVNKVIGVAPVKDHHRSGASMSMKNWYGLLGGRRNIFHQDIHTIIKELAMLIKPSLVVLDGTTAMVTNGPTGGSLSDLKSTNTMIVSTDQVAADAYGASLIGKSALELPFITKADEIGIGTADYKSLNPVFVNG
jgi:uncharacterized protein (DUF362 family)